MPEAPPLTQSDLTQSDLAVLNARFEPASPRSILKWAFSTFGDGAVMGTGFGASGVVLMHLLAEAQPGATVFYLDTDLLFPETYTLRDRLAAHLDLDVVRVHSGVSLDAQAEQHGNRLWSRDPDRCCFIRKLKPLREYLADQQAWITAIRRDQSPGRTETNFVEWSAANDVVKVNPLADWTEEDIWTYIDVNDLPYNPLHDAGYPSIGCMPCTEPVTGKDGDPRAGRWAGTAKTECGLHLEPQPVST